MESESDNLLDLKMTFLWITFGLLTIVYMQPDFEKGVLYLHPILQSVTQCVLG